MKNVFFSCPLTFLHVNLYLNITNQSFSTEVYLQIKGRVQFVNSGFNYFFSSNFLARLTGTYIYQEGSHGIPLNGLILPYVYACSKPGQGFPTLYAVGFFLWSVSSVKMRGDCSFC
jgi:hypothetical protein